MRSNTAHWIDMNSIELLKSKINTAFSGNSNLESLGIPGLMSKALADVKLAFDTPRDALPSRSVTLTLFSYRNSGKLQTFLDVKYVCFGVGQQVGDDEWCLLNDPALFKKLLGLVDKYQLEPRRFRKCYQGLLSGYFGYHCHSNKTSEDGRTNWKSLRIFLDKRLPIALSETSAGSWFAVLEDHVNLLKDKPCERYKDALLANDYTELKAVCNTLGVPSDSWVWEEAIISQVEAACSLPEAEFKNHLKPLLKSIADNRVSHLLSIRCVTLLLVRYVACNYKEEHPELRDSAVQIIGNPWLNTAMWDAHVQNDNARIMVDGWLKKRLIFDFFSLLSEDGSADQRRLNYWLRFESAIGDMWFALGPHARHNTGVDFKQFRERAKGRLLDLENGGPAENNAFILCLGDLIVVEFGSKGNACYVYSNTQLPFELGKRQWVRADVELKSQSKGERFIHRDGGSSGVSWEEKLDDWLCPRLAWRPSEMPHNLTTKHTTNRVYQSPNQHVIRRQAATQLPLFDESEFYKFTVRNNLTVRDLRIKGGALWVITHTTDQGISKMLTDFGFKYKYGRGWWKE